MFIVFEGIDGSGKTTLSNRVAARLRSLGHRVCHAREGGELASPIAERLRGFTRDPHHLALTDRAELLLCAAREAQTVEEVVRPALERGEWVIADRYVYSHLALASEGRGLEDPDLWQVLRFAVGGLLPELVVFVDVEPSIARARKRAGKLHEGRACSLSRKRQAGAGLPQRLRRGYYRLAHADPEHWIVFDNTWASLDEAEEAIARAIVARAEGRPLPALPRARSPIAPSEPASLRDERRVREALLDAVDRIALREPPLAAHLLRGLSGEDVDERRLRLSLLAPAVIASGLLGVWDEGALTVRHALKAVVADAVALSLLGARGSEAMNLRLELARRAPAAVARSLEGATDEQAMRLRRDLASHAPADVLVGLGGVDHEEAWELRGALWTGSPPDACALSLKGLTSEAAWTLREELRGSAPLSLVEGLVGLGDPRAHALRAWQLRRAPRAVLETLLGVDDEPAWHMREALGERMREAAESAMGLAGERAWALRGRLAATWPSSVVRSLAGLAHEARARALLFAVLEQASGDLEVLREAAWVLDPAAAPARPSPELPLPRAV